MEGATSSTWVLCGDYDEVLPNVQFIPGQNPTTPRIVSNVQKPIDFFKLFFINELVKKIIRKTNKYAKRKVEGKTRCLQLRYGEAGVMSPTKSSGHFLLSLSIWGQCRWPICKNIRRRMSSVIFLSIRIHLQETDLVKYFGCFIWKLFQHAPPIHERAQLSWEREK